MTTYTKRYENVISPVIGHYTSLEIVKGQGSYLYTKEGTAYLDFSSGIGVTSTGHCHPNVVAAIHKQAETLIHPCIGVAYCEPPILLAEKITQLIPEPTSVFFNQSGSEAMETAIKLAKYVTKRQKLIAFKGGFHGRTMGALSITSSKESYREGYGTLIEPVHFCEYPTEQNMEVLCDDAAFDESVAAVIIEPMLGEGGYIPCPQPFLKKLEKKCRDIGALLILDEIQTGFGKTGTWFAFEQYGVMPDILTLAKGLGSGMPIGACVAKQRVMNQWPTGSHGSTFSGNPVTCAAASATLDVISGCLDSVKSRGLDVMTRLKKDCSNISQIKEIRGLGLMIGVECESAQVAKEIMQLALKKKLILISCGSEQQVIRLIPSLTMTDDDLNKGIDILLEVIRELY